MGNEEEPTKDTKTDSNPSIPPPAPEAKATKEPEQTKKPDVDSLRTVIKVNQEETPAKQEKKEEKTAEKPKEKKETPAKIPTPEPAMPEDAKSELEQRRNILRSIKDFDFLIKKNQEDISKVTEQINGLTNDLDDLVSLYEIVSEQMNPFVGLSKVTKKRLDALENFTKEVEDVKTKIGDLESEMEKMRGAIKTGQLYQMAPKAPKPTTPLPANGDKTTAKPETKPPENKTPETVPPAPGSPSPVPPMTTIPNSPSPSTPVQPVPSTVTPPTPFITPMAPLNSTEETTLSDVELDALFSKSLESMVYEDQIDTMINEFLLSLK